MNLVTETSGFETRQGHRDHTKVNVIEAIADWCDALHGNVSLEEAVAGLVESLGAEAGMLVRSTTNTIRPTKIATFDRARNQSSSPLSCDFGQEIFGSLLNKSKAATIWLATMHADRLSEEYAVDFRRWQATRGMKEFAVLVLSTGAVSRDHLELHFRRPLSETMRASLAIVLPAMARTWATRQVGLVAKSSVVRRIEKTPFSRQLNSAPILGISNPAKLSRAEFRVCLLLSRGLSVSGVCSELSLADATVRTHLRNIYAKSDTSNLAGLVFCLLSQQPADAGVAAISA